MVAALGRLLEAYFPCNSCARNPIERSVVITESRLRNCLGVFSRVSTSAPGPPIFADSVMDHSCSLLKMGDES